MKNVYLSIFFMFLLLAFSVLVLGMIIHTYSTHNTPGFTGWMLSAGLAILFALFRR